MKIPSYVKKHPFFWKHTPILKNSGGNSIYPLILVREEVYKDLLKDKPQPKSIALLLHEETHRQRQKKSGWLFWGVKYFTIPSFRFNEELEAYKITMKVYKKHDIYFDIERIAKHLAGPLYMWSTSYNNARSKLQDAWENA